MFLKKDPGANAKLQESIVILGTTDDMFTLKYKDAFRHVIFSLKIFFVKNTSSDNIIKEILDYIPSYETLPTEQKAAITAIKSHVFSEYGPNGTKHALILAKEALRGNPEEGEWSFLVGKMLARIRQFNYDHCVTEEELECFRHAYALSKSASHATFLALTYLNISKSLYSKLPLGKGRRVMNVNESQIINGYNEKSLNLFKEALEKNDNKCTHINFRCAKGLYFLPGQFKDVPKALELIEQTLERAPTNVYGNSVAATIYFTLQQYDKAFKHAYAAEEGGSYGASIKILQMKVELKQDFEIDKMFENIFQKHPEIMYKIQTCMNAITYFIFKKRNIFRALNYFFKAANMEAKLEDFYFYVFWIKETTDLCFIVYNEVKCAAENGISKDIKQLKKLRDAMTVICTKYPKAAEKKLEPKLVDILIKRSNVFRRNIPKRQFNNKYKTKQNHKENNYNINNNDKKTVKKGNNKDPKRRTSRKRTDSESSNTSACSFASAASFTRIRRNSKEACLLDIVAKDMKVINRCQDFKEAVDTKNVASLRPCLDKNQPTLGFGSDTKRPLSMGCTGWNKNSKTSDKKSYNKSDKINANQKYGQHRDEFTNLSKSFDKRSLGNNTPNYRRNRSLSSDENQSKYNDRFQKSLSTSTVGGFRNNYNDSNSEVAIVKKLDNSKTGKQLTREKSPNYFSNKSYSNYNKPSSSRDKNYHNSYKEFNQDYKNKNNGNQFEVTNASKTRIRKPFNLRRSDSLDSDDSVNLRRSPSVISCDRSSISSVDDDYKATKPYFSWQNKSYR
uniref:Uncharacterized protein n=3 Tax=Rhodnius TaxID=13248 RepID=T1HV09_RHOPR